MLNFSLIFSLLMVVFVVSSCSTPEEVTITEEQEKVAGGTEVSFEAETNKPVYVYEENKEEQLPEITLVLNNEPILLTSGYVRLVGVVSGGKPMALVEVGGQGLVVGVGDRISGYVAISISNNAINLRRNIYEDTRNKMQETKKIQ